MAERKFTRSLVKPGVSAQLRETVSQVLRETTLQKKAESIEPVDYESYVLKNKTLLLTDPQRELLLFPSDDVAQEDVDREERTLQKEITESDIKNVPSLFIRECLKSYIQNWKVIRYKYNEYGGSYLNLPRMPKEAELHDQVYEVDAELDDASLSLHLAESITKQGYLLKGPDSGLFGNIASKSFKKRFVHLRQGVDGSYFLEFFKDERCPEPKLTVLMDVCQDVISAKRGRFSFELKMPEGQKSYILAAETESELSDWVNKLQKVIQVVKQQEDRKSLLGSERGLTPPLTGPEENYGTLRGLEHSLNPQLTRYAHETEFSISQARKDHRQKIFSLYADMPRTPVGQCADLDELAEPWAEFPAVKVTAICQDIRFRLRVRGEDGSYDQVEPYHTTLAVFDAREGKKISEDFVFDVNSPTTRSWLNKNTNNCVPPQLADVPPQWLNYPKKAVFSVSSPHSDVYLVLRVEKTLQGSIYSIAEPYSRPTDSKLAARYHKAARNCCSRLSEHRMPFAWAARPLFKTYTYDFDPDGEFSPLYRQDPGKLKDEDLVKLLQDLRKPDKLSRLTPIPGLVKISVTAYNHSQVNMISPSLYPLHPFPIPPQEDGPVREIVEFFTESAEKSVPLRGVMNFLYVYPVSLTYEGQKYFHRARNISCTVQVKDSDAEGAQPLQLISGRPEDDLLTTQASCTVLHHMTSPDFYTEVKIHLPLEVQNLHLLFIFNHVSCEPPKTSKRGSTVPETPIGYSWLPLFQKGRLATGKQSLPVAITLPNGYLAVENLGLGKGFSGPEIRWVDGRKPIFQLDVQLHSSVLSEDQHLMNFFSRAQQLLCVPRPPSSDSLTKDTSLLTSTGSDTSRDLAKVIKAVLAVEPSLLIRYLAPLLKQLLTLLVYIPQEDIGFNIVRTLVHIVDTLQEANHQHILYSYIKYVFDGSQLNSMNGRTVHEVLTKVICIVLRPANNDSISIQKLLRHLDFFTRLLAKSMAQHLVSSGRIKMQRHERFSSDYQYRLQEMIHLLTTHIQQKHKEHGAESIAANTALATLVKRLISLMDRGFVFRLISNYMDKLSSVEGPFICDYKFKFLREVISHEHYIPLNLPRSPSSLKGKEVMDIFFLSDSFCSSHYLTGLLLREVRASLNDLPHPRQTAIRLLRDILAKHAFDDRYQQEAAQSRIVSLYLPVVSIILENLFRLDIVSKERRGSQAAIAHLATPQRNRVIDKGKPSYLQSRDSSYLSLIAGQAPPWIDPGHLGSQLTVASSAGPQPLKNGLSISSVDSGGSGGMPATSSQDSLDISEGTLRPSKHGKPTHTRCGSVVTGSTERHDKLGGVDAQDLLLCFLYVCQCAPHSLLLSWWKEAPQEDVLAFFKALHLCLEQFRYSGRHPNKASNPMPPARGSKKAATLPARMNPPDFNMVELASHTQNMRGGHGMSGSEVDTLFNGLLEANLSNEVGLIVMDNLGLYSMHMSEQLCSPNSPELAAMFDIYIYFLQTSQSECLLKHVFASWRAFISKYPQVMFDGSAEYCGRLVLELLRCCNSKLSSTRHEACALLYLLMRANYEYTQRKGITRSHLQMVICVSKLLGEVVSLNNTVFQESLSRVNSYAGSDKAMSSTGFTTVVYDLTKRVRTVLMATAQLREHECDPEMLAALQHSLANSYAATPELRKTWLHSLAKLHTRRGDYSEAALCHIHIAALMAEYLKLKGVFPQGCKAFEPLSINIAQDESNLKDDAGMQEVPYTLEGFLEQLELCVKLLFSAERYEMLGDLYRIVIPLLEKRRDWQALTEAYMCLSQAYKRVGEVSVSGRRLLGTYFRVAFFNHAYFEEDAGKEYIYKEPKVTALVEISDRLYQQFTTKFGKGNVKIIMDSSPVDVDGLDSSFAYIQLTHVQPYFEEYELDQRPTYYEQNHNIRKFVYETPFTAGGNKSRGNIEEQCLRRTVLTTAHWFPYVVKRVMVIHQRQIELNPLEVAIGEMTSRVKELQQEVGRQPPDLKKLQLKLQGSISVTVNAGPLAYAQAFLHPDAAVKYPENHVALLKNLFREFVKVCDEALVLNEKLIGSEQAGYQQALKESFKMVVEALGSIGGGDLTPLPSTPNKRSSAALFSIISGTSSGASSA